MSPPADVPADERLLLLAQEAAEVPLLSALVQSATLRLPDIAYDARARRLVLLVNRYRWEDPTTRTRVRSALRIESVLSVQRRSWPNQTPGDPGVTVLELLAFTLDADTLTLTFAGGAALRVTVEVPDLVLEDVSGPWAAGSEPRYE